MSTKKELREWQIDHWRAIALADLIFTATTEQEENERLLELRKIKKRWGYTLITGYDPNAFRSGASKQAKRVSKNTRRHAEEYVPASGSLGKGSAASATGRIQRSSHGR